MKCDKCEVEEATHVIITETTNKIYTLDSEDCPNKFLSEYVEDLDEYLQSDIVGNYCEKCLAEETANVQVVETIK